MIVREGDPKHGSGEDRGNYAFQLDGFFRIHGVDSAENATSVVVNAEGQFQSTCESRRNSVSRRRRRPREDADALRADALR